MKKQKMTFIGIIALAIILGIVAALTANLSDFKSGLLSGMSSAMFVIGLIRLIRILRLEKNPEMAAEYEAAQKDERILYIANKARAWTFLISILTELAAGLIALFAFDQRTLGQGLCMLVCFQCLLFVILFRVMEKKY